METRIAMLWIAFAFITQTELVWGQAETVLSPNVEVADQMDSVPDVGDDPKGILYVPNEHHQVNPQLEGWWLTKVAWFMPLSYVGEVRVSGFNIEDNSPMYFEFDDSPTAAGTLNPAEPGGFVEGLDDWAFFPSYVWISKAGCYQIEAEWDGGAWRQIIAAGNIDWD